MRTPSTSDIGFEKQIWDAACVLRGNLDASEYKSVVLKLLFLKYISDSFDVTIRDSMLFEKEIKKIEINMAEKILFHVFHGAIGLPYSYVTY